MQCLCEYNTTEKLELQEELAGKWTTKKNDSFELSKVYRALGLDSKADRLASCGDFLEFAINKETGERKIYNANFCKVRLCPTCSWRRSLKVFGQLSKIMESMKKDGWQFLFLTLTIRNVKDYELSASIDELLSGYKALKRKKCFKKSIYGDYRSLEITRNPKTGLYHPHIHAILAVLPSYFKKSELYITQEKWASLWQKSMKIDYRPIIDVRRVKPKMRNGEVVKDISAVVAETAKYTVKSQDYLTGNLENDKYFVSVLDAALSHRRLIGMGGVFKEIHNELNLDDPETGSLVEQIAVDPEIWVLFKYHWRGTGYVQW